MISACKTRRLGADDISEFQAFLQEFSERPLLQQKKRADQQRIEQAEDLGFAESLRAGQMPWFGLEAKHGLSGIAGVRPALFDSEIYRISMAEVMRLAVSDLEEARYLLARLRQFAVESSVTHLACRVNTNDVLGRHLLEKTGFLLMDTSIEYLWNPQLLEIVEQAHAWQATVLGRPLRIPKFGLKYRGCVPADAEPLGEISRESFTRHTLSRYANDPTLPLNLTGEFYAQWARNAVAGEFGDFVLVAELGRQPVGFQVIRRERSLSAAAGLSIGTLGIGAVVPRYRGHAVFPGLLAGVLEWSRRNGLEVVRGRTLANNVSMHQTCHLMGGVLCSSYHSFHLSNIDRQSSEALPRHKDT